jgi:hypothetical protein
VQCRFLKIKIAVRAVFEKARAAIRLKINFL